MVKLMVVHLYLGLVWAILGLNGFATYHIRLANILLSGDQQTTTVRDER